MYKISLVTAVVLGTIGLGIASNNIVNIVAQSQEAVAQQTATDNDDPIVPPNVKS